MQKQHLKLEEIVWEITGECKNNCNYCGSKETTKNKTTNETILKIADSIALYPPTEINISGGDPLLVEKVIHEEILKEFREQKMICKIICNPKSLLKDKENSFAIINLYDWTGLSINNVSELEKAKNFLSEYYIKKITIITNFNALNLYEYDTIEAFVKKMGFAWTIQHTIYKDRDNEAALYNNEAALNILQEKVNKSVASGINIILSDNIRENASCTAGFASLGITYDGYVIPCLSMRSWCEPVNEVTPSIYKDSLEDIWKEFFDAQRFGCFECCKDACKNKTIGLYKENSQTKIDISFPVVEKPIIPDVDMGRVIAYAVAYPGNMVMMYGVFGDVNGGVIYGTDSMLNKDKYSTSSETDDLKTKDKNPE